MSVINVDDAFGARSGAAASGRPLLRVLEQVDARRRRAPGRRRLLEPRGLGDPSDAEGDVNIDSPLLGAHNLSNMLVCARRSRAALDLDLAATASSLSEAAVPGQARAV